MHHCLPLSAILLRPLIYLVLLQLFTTDPVKDFMYFNEIMDHWLDALRRDISADAQYPPGLGLLMQLGGGWWPLAHPYDIRASLMAWDALATGVAWWCLRSPQAAPAWRLPLLVFLLPLTAIWAQDEVIAAAFLALMCWWLRKERWPAALLLSALAVGFVKIFFLPLCALLLLTGWRQGVARGWLLATVLLLAMMLLWQFSGSAAGLSHFVPPNDFGISLWSSHPDFEQVAARASYRQSLLLFLIAGGLWGLWVWRHLSATAEQAMLAFAVLLQLFSLTFYHVNPEYLVFSCWLYLLLPATRGAACTIGVMLTWAMAWSVNVAFYLQQTHPVLQPVYQLLLLTYNLVNVGLLLLVLREARRLSGLAAVRLD